MKIFSQINNSGNGLLFICFSKIGFSSKLCPKDNTRKFQLILKRRSSVTSTSWWMPMVANRWRWWPASLIAAEDVGKTRRKRSCLNVSKVRQKCLNTFISYIFMSFTVWRSSLTNLIKYKKTVYVSHVKQCSVTPFLQMMQMTSDKWTEVPEAPKIKALT